MAHLDSFVGRIREEAAHGSSPSTVPALAWLTRWGSDVELHRAVLRGLRAASARWCSEHDPPVDQGVSIPVTTTPNTRWFKSSYSNDQGGNCVEGARVASGAMAVRDSKDPARGAFLFPCRTWGAFLAALKEDDARL